MSKIMKQLEAEGRAARGRAMENDTIEVADEQIALIPITTYEWPAELYDPKPFVVISKP